jgi:hypothetical protein
MRRVLLPALVGTAALVLGSGCVSDRLLFQSHAVTPGWVQAPPAPTAERRSYVGRAQVRGSFDEAAAMTAARDDIERQLVADVAAAGVGPLAPATALDIHQSLAGQRALEVYWEQWLSQPLPLLGERSVYRFHLLLGVPAADFERWRRTPR